MAAPIPGQGQGCQRSIANIFSMKSGLAGEQIDMEYV